MHKEYAIGIPNPELIAPKGYALDPALMARPGNADIQLDLFLDYANNVKLYPAFHECRGVSRVEFSIDYGNTWSDAEIYYSGGNLAWSLWKTHWMPTATGYYNLLVCATDGEGRRPEMGRRSRPFLRHSRASHDGAA